MKEKIIELRKNGLTINEIVKELGCAKSTVSYNINKIGLGGELKPRIYCKKDETELFKQIRDLRLLLKTYDEILTIVNISKDKLKKICRKLKLNKPSSGFEEKSLDKKEVLIYYLNVKSLRKTAKFFNVDRTTLRKYINDEDIIIKREKKVTRSQSVVDWRKRKKIQLVEYKGGCCERCGYNKTVQALQFHHLDSKEKDFAIGSKSYSYERLRKEVDKCIMVCANCHIEIHEELRNK